MLSRHSFAPYPIREKGDLVSTYLQLCFVFNLRRAARPILRRPLAKPFSMVDGNDSKPSMDPHASKQAPPEEGPSPGMIELRDPADEIKRQLHPNTGTEEDQVWPCIPPEQTPAPLLDLNDAWDKLANALPIPADGKEPPTDDLNLRNASILVTELKYHLLASTHREYASDSDDKNADSFQSTQEETPSDAKHSSAVTSNEQSASPGASAPSSEKDNTTTSDKHSVAAHDPAVASKPKRKSVFGASMMLKFRWEDRKVQKRVPNRTYAQFAVFIADITTHLKKLSVENNTAFQAMIDAIALDLTPALLARLMDGIETITPELETACHALLFLCARQAAPKEMHVALLSFIRKIDSVYYEATSYLALDPLLRMWTEVILRIPRKRAAFLTDLIKVYDRMMMNGEAYQHVSIPLEDGVGSEQPGLLDNVHDILLNFFERLVVVQKEHRDSSADVREKVDVLGRALPSFSLAIGMANPDDAKLDQAAVNAQKGTVDPSKASHGKKEQDNDAAGDVTPAQEDKTTLEAVDWVKERAITLARLLKVFTVMWDRLPAPPGEERGSSSSKKERKQKVDASTQACHDKAEDALATCMRLFNDLGWSNPVLVCQVGFNGLNLDVVSHEDEVLREHIGSDVRNKKEKKNTLYSVLAVGQVMCAYVRPQTLKRLGKLTGPVNPYRAVIDGSGFDLLSEEYAFYLALPYVTAMISQVSVLLRVTGLTTLRTLLERLPENCFEQFEDIVRLRCGTMTLGRETSILGASLHIARAVSALDDPVHRGEAYDTLQMLLKRCRDPGARFMMMESALIDSQRVAMAAQLVTELKDVLRYSDEIAWGQGAVNGYWSRLQASELKTRFVRGVLPRYLGPRKEMLANINAMVAVSAACAYVAGSDARHLKVETEEGELRKSILWRQKYLRLHMKLGRECVRALAAVAEYDRKKMPESALAKESLSDAKALFTASGRTLNQCVAALTSLEMAEKLATGE